jgi:uncharacterized protein (DUF488 family)
VTRVWTIGHSTRTIEEFIGALQTHGIKLVADVRLLPGSKRYPQFNKEMLAKSLTDAGIGYEHVPELGGRRKPREDSRNTAWRNDAFRGYADHMETPEFVAGIARLEEATERRGAAAIMCGGDHVCRSSLVEMPSQPDRRLLEGTRSRNHSHYQRERSRATPIYFGSENC